MRNTTHPHTAVVSFEIKIHEELPDKSLDPTIMTDAELEKFGLTKRAVFCVSGFNLKNCVENLKAKMEKLNDS